MSKFEIKRSAVLGAFVLTSIVVLNGALARPRAPFGGVRVDVASLRAEAGDPTARWVAEELPRALTEALVSVGAWRGHSVRALATIRWPSSRAAWKMGRAQGS